MTEEAPLDPGVVASLDQMGKAVRPGDVHTVGYLHPAAFPTISREGWLHHAQQIADHLAKHPAVPSADDVEVHVFNHDHMTQAMADAGVEGPPTSQPFDAAALVAIYRAT